MDGKECSRRKPGKKRCGPRPRPEVSPFSSAANIPVDEVATLFRCGKCLVAPIKPPVYTCRNGHLNCGNCYRKLTRDCYKCKEPLLGRNALLEEVMRGLPIQTCAALSDCTVPLRESRSEQSLQQSLQDPMLLEKLEVARQEAEKQERSRKSEVKVTFQCESKNLQQSDSKSSGTSNSSVVSLDSLHIRPSSRPVPCPFPCSSRVTCSSLVPHFEFHHPHVFITKVSKDCIVNIKIPFQEIKFTDEDEGRCIIFFVVKIDDGPDDGEDFSKSADVLRVTRSSQEMVRRGYFVVLLSAGRLPTNLGADSWFLAVWASALYDFAPVTYTLRASSNDGTRCYSFKGPPSSLHKDQRPGEVYKRGECLTVPPALLRCFHDHDHNLDLSIKFHSDLPFPFVPPSPTFDWTPDTQGLII